MGRREKLTLHIRAARQDAEHDVDGALHEARAAALPRIGDECDFHASIIRDGLHVVGLAAVETLRTVLHALGRFLRHARVAERMDADAQHGTGVGGRSKRRQLHGKAADEQHW